MKHKQNIHRVTNLLNSMTGVCWKNTQNKENYIIAALIKASLIIKSKQMTVLQ